MSYFIRMNFLLGIIILSVLSKASAIQSSYNSDIVPVLKRVLITGDSVVYYADSSGFKIPEHIQTLVLNYRNNNITFELSPSENINYQFFLEGFDKEWSSWKSVSFKEYTNLPYGKYRFKIRYLISGNSGGELPLISIRVLPLWYFSHLALVVYFLLFSVVIWAVYDILNLRFARRQYSL